jgi:hypothetical protein
MPEEPREAREPPSRRGAVLGLLVALALIVLGLVLVKLLGHSTRLEDCALSGRTNCAPIDSNGGSQ